MTTDGDLAFSGAAFVPMPAGTYAMLGDSYSSGNGTGVYDPNTVNYSTPLGTNNAHRSRLSYNRVFAAGTATFGAITDPDSTDPAKNWFDVACSGAVIADYGGVNPMGSCPDELEQKAVLNAQTSLVTLTLGGDDLHFADVIRDCVFIRLPNNCKNKWDATLRAEAQELSDPANPNGLPKLYTDIRTDAPNAEVVVLGYPHLFMGSSGSTCPSGGLIVGTIRDWLNSMTDLLDETLQSSAEAAGVDYVSTIDLLSGHELCTSAPWFNGFQDPNPNDTQDGLIAYIQSAPPQSVFEWLHPNATGYAQEARLLASDLPIP